MPRAGYRTNNKPSDRAAALDAQRDYLKAFIQERIAEQDAGYSTHCWAWQGYLRSDGYAEADLGRGIGRVRIHRLSYEVFVGLIPDSLVLDHLCLNQACCNPEHLEPVTSAENTRRAHALKHSHSGNPETHCGNGHERTPDSTYSNGHCKQCQQACSRRWVEKNRGRVYANQRRWKENNPDRVAEARKREKMKQRAPA